MSEAHGLGEVHAAGAGFRLARNPDTVRSSRRFTFCVRPCLPIQRTILILRRRFEALAVEGAFTPTIRRGRFHEDKIPTF